MKYLLLITLLFSFSLTVSASAEGEVEATSCDQIADGGGSDSPPDEKTKEVESTTNPATDI
tara:strand:+ start:1351 stop:1533 length:183 start_codon:yes stop_codon:yes gene_type:complete